MTEKEIRFEVLKWARTCVQATISHEHMVLIASTYADWVLDGIVPGPKVKEPEPLEQPEPPK